MVEQQAPLTPIREQFDVTSPRFGFTMSSFPMPRLWFTSEDGHQLVQVQHDLFILNWRKLDPPADYPRYERLRQRLIDEIGVFEEFLGVGARCAAPCAGGIDVRQSHRCARR
jgi:uncharacterized protein (TIGR04255 family)